MGLKYLMIHQFYVYIHKFNYMSVSALFYGTTNSYMSTTSIESMNIVNCDYVTLEICLSIFMNDLQLKCEVISKNLIHFILLNSKLTPHLFIQDGLLLFYNNHGLDNW